MSVATQNVMNPQSVRKPGQWRYGEYFKISKGDDSLGFRKYFFFRVYHPMFPTVLFGGLGLLLISIARIHLHYSAVQILLFWLAGIFLWGFAEYLIHRFLFHWTSMPPTLRKIFPDLHMAHHRDTKDRSLHMAPQAFSLMVTTIFFFIIWAITQSLGITLLLLSGIVSGYVFYEWSHYGSHEYRWKRGFLGYLKRNHLYHHFKAPNDVFGVTSSMWDHVFRTKKV